MTKREVPDLPGFNAWWAAWPGNRPGGYGRKGGKSQCLARWIKHHHESQADTICRHVEWLKTTADWIKDGGAYIPMPITYLNQQRWDGAEIPSAAAPAQRAESRREREARERVERIAPGAAVKTQGGLRGWQVAIEELGDGDIKRIG